MNPNDRVFANKGLRVSLDLLFTIINGLAN